MIRGFIKILSAVFLLFPLKGISQSTEIKYLSGTGSDHTVSWQFFCTGGMNANKWTTIAVPSCWELQGFGKYDYGFAKDSIRGKEKGLYKYEFDVSPAWKNKQINLVFEGVMTDAEVKVNGQSAGAIHQGAFYSFKYDISSLLKFDTKNLLEVTVAKHSSNTSVNEAERKADFWIFGGIFRPVFLEVMPRDHIEQVLINAKADGTFEGSCELNSQSERMVVQIFNPDGTVFGKISGDGMHIIQHPYSNLEKEFGAFKFKSKFSNPKTWSSESPNLYKAVFSIYRKNILLHSVTRKFGFRTVELKQRDGIYVNGVKVKMKGVNRHSFRPETGRTMSKQNSIEDVLLMKDMNMNAVRMSHYPPDDHFLDVCDSLGLFVMDELAGWHGHYDTPTGSKLVKEMLEHDRNHPSIIMWSNGNEGGHNFDLDSLFGEYDLQGRPVIHPWQLFNGIETQHYREYNYGIGNYENGREIVMPTEFLHGQFDGGHGAGLEDYWEKMWHNPLSAGGFLWDFADQGVVRKDLHDSLDTDKFRGADGILGPHHEKEGSYYAIKEIWSPIYFERREITPDFDGVFNIENRYHFTNLKQCSFSFRLKEFEIGYDDVMKAITAPNILPNSKGVLRLQLPKDWKEYTVLYIEAKGPDGKEIFTWSFPIDKAYDFTFLCREKRPGVFPGIQTAIDKSNNGDSAISVIANKISYAFNRHNGLLVSVTKSGKLIPFNNGPVLCEGNAPADSVVLTQTSPDEVDIICFYPKKGLINFLKWTINSKGILKMEIHYFPSAYFTNMVGVNFSFPEKEIRAVDWMGNGPYRVWKNRMKGTQFGVWHKDYNNTETGESWVYPEFKGYHSNMYWCKFTTSTQPFTVYTENEDLFFRLFTPAWKTDQWHNYEPIFPGGDISFMQGISSIGTKTQRNETTGPMGMKNIFYDYEKDPSRALKMVLYFDFNVE